METLTLEVYLVELINNQWLRRDVGMAQCNWDTVSLFKRNFGVTRLQWPW